MYTSIADLVRNTTLVKSDLEMINSVYATEPFHFSFNEQRGRWSIYSRKRQVPWLLAPSRDNDGFCAVYESAGKSAVFTGPKQSLEHAISTAHILTDQFLERKLCIFPNSLYYSVQYGFPAALIGLGLYADASKFAADVFTGIMTTIFLGAAAVVAASIIKPSSVLDIKMYYDRLPVKGLSPESRNFKYGADALKEIKTDYETLREQQHLSAFYNALHEFGYPISKESVGKIIQTLKKFEAKQPIHKMIRIADDANPSLRVPLADAAQLYQICV